MWLRDSLPQDLQKTKLWTYGYDSAIAWSSSVSGITDFARDLLERLLPLRLTAHGAECTFIFICHSLGGIVFKKALTLAVLVPDYKVLLGQVKAVVFMGTPHRGSRISSYVTPLTRIVNAALFTPAVRSTLIGSLQSLSRDLSEIAEMAAVPLSKIPAISFYEQKRMSFTNCLVSFDL